MSRNQAVRYRVGSWTLLIPLLLLGICPPGRTETLVLTNQWSVLLGSLSDSSPAIGADGTIYFGTFLGDLYALTPGGSRKWIFSAGREIRSSPAIGPDGTLYFGSRNRKLFAVGPTGQEKWEFKTGGWVDSSPAVAGDGTVYFGSWDKSFYALGPDGVKKWLFPTAGEIVSSPAIGADGSIYFGSHDHKFYCLAPDGKKNWEYPTGAPIISSPAINEEGGIYITSVDGFFYALNPDGSLKWRLKTGGITESSPVIGQDGTIFVGVNESLWAITREGTKKWAGPPQLPITEAPLVLENNSVCFVSGGLASWHGYLCNLRVPGEYNWTFDLGCFPAALGIGANNTIYTTGVIGDVGTKLYAISNHLRMAQSPWPKFRGNPQNTGRR